MTFLTGLFSCVSTNQQLDSRVDSPPYDVIIVPGIPFYKDWSDNIMKERVIWSWYLYSNGFTKNVIYSGSAVYTPYIEARIMAKYGEALGIPKEHIICEEHALHSTQNVMYGYQLARKMGFKRIAVASDEFQTSTLKLFAWDFGVPVDFIPFNPKRLNGLNIAKDIAIDPGDAYVKDFVSLPAKENLLLRIRGTMGFGMKKF